MYESNLNLFLFPPDQIKFEWAAKDGWLKMNTHQMGFYRVNYDNENWDALSAQLQADHMVSI